MTKVSDIKVFGDGDTFKLLCKASSESQGWMKSTKVANLPNGCLVQVSTQQRNPDGSYSVAEALQFVPDIEMGVWSSDGIPYFRALEKLRSQPPNNINITIDKIKSEDFYDSVNKLAQAMSQ